MALRRLHLLATLALLLASCGDDILTTLTLPWEDGARTMVVAFRVGGQVVDAYVVTPDRRELTLEEFDNPGHASVFAVAATYFNSPDELGLIPGQLRFAPNGRLLPPPDFLFTAELLEEEGFSAWQPSASIEELGELRIF